MDENEKLGPPDLRQRPLRKPTSGRRISRRLVATSSAAVLAIYAVGFVRTQSAANQFETAANRYKSSQSRATPDLPSSSSTATSSGSPPTAEPSEVATVAPTAAATPTAASQRYRDGTYTGTGTSRHGDITAQVMVKGGKIVAANITACYTRYPCSRISDLPGAVVDQQSTNVDMVSGATDSSEAYLQAVDNALQRAG